MFVTILMNGDATMEILNFYLVNRNTLHMMPIVTADGHIYTFVLEKGTAAIITKPPSVLIEESKRYYLECDPFFHFESKWESEFYLDEKRIPATFKLTVKLYK
jgi:hypothetical protein